MNIVLIVSDDRSDLYFANQLARRVRVSAVFVERQRSSGGQGKLARYLRLAANPVALCRKLRERKIWKEHYSATGLIDDDYFGEDGLRLDLPEGCRVIETDGARTINDPEYVESMRRLQPDLIAVCGCSILKREILAIPPKGVLNLHGGLAQRYRGIWTTLWAVVNEEPEYVGATVHYVSPGIDDGDVLYQGRPEIAADDNPETLYCKVVRLGIRMMERAISDIEQGKASPFRLASKGDLYLGRMVTAETIRTAWVKIDKGIIPQYLANRRERDEKVTALMQGIFQ